MRNIKFIFTVVFCVLVSTLIFCLLAKKAFLYIQENIEGFLFGAEMSIITLCLVSILLEEGLYVFHLLYKLIKTRDFEYAEVSRLKEFKQVYFMSIGSIAMYLAFLGLKVING